MAKYAVVFWEMDKKGQKTSQSCSSCEAVNAKAAMMDFLGLYGPKRALPMMRRLIQPLSITILSAINQGGQQER